MNLKKITILLSLCAMVGGCNAKDGEEMDRAKYGIPVQEYTGVEYPAGEKSERWEYIEQHRKDIEDRAIQWVKETFGLDVKINHMYPTNGAAIATAEWLGDSNLKIKVVVGLDEKSERITSVIPSMYAENNIMSYIVYKVYKEELDKLDMLLMEFCQNENLHGLTDTYIHNMGSFASIDSNYYYISGSYLSYQRTYSAFLNDPFISASELKKIFELEYEEDKRIKIEKDQDYGVSFQISLYSDSNKIDEGLFALLEESLVEQCYLPDFNYAFTMSENTVDTRTDRARNIQYPDAPTITGYIRVNREKE